MFKNKKFECYLLKNRIPGVVLAVLMTVFMLMMAGRFELLNRLDSKTYRTLNEIESISNPYGSDVKITVDRADYLGYDYFVDSERQGSYYICQQDGRYAILLLKSNDDVVLNYTIKGRMISGGSEYSSIIDGITSDMGIAAAQLETRMYPLIISEVDFPRIYYNMMLLVLIVTVLWSVYVIVRCIYEVSCPWKVRSVRDVLGKRADRQTIRDIDSQLRYEMYYEQYGIAITDKYFVCHGMWHTDVVALDNIETFKKLRTSSNIGSGKKKIYKLLMVDVDGVTYEQDFRSEKDINEALSYLSDDKRVKR